MKDLAAELMLIEDRAAAFYYAMAAYFQDAPAVAAALTDLATDEEAHSEIMNVVATCMTEGHETTFPLELNSAAKVAISDTMDDCISMSQAGKLTIQKLGEAIIDIEFSEWNSLFFYVVNSYKDISHDCKMAAIQLQGHIRKIQRFLDQLSLDSDLLARIRHLPSLWTENILVIDDEGTVRELLKAVFHTLGNVEMASDGVEGLEKIHSKYYALIVSDIKMPKCDGIALFQQANQLFPSIGKRFLFFSAAVSEDQSNFIRHHNIELINKPAPLKEILSKASALLTATGITN